MNLTKILPNPMTRGSAPNLQIWSLHGDIVTNNFCNCCSKHREYNMPCMLKQADDLVESLLKEMKIGPLLEKVNIKKLITVWVITEQVKIYVKRIFLAKEILIDVELCSKAIILVQKVNITIFSRAII